MTKITGFKHIATQGVDDCIALFFNEGAIGLIHDLPHHVINDCLMQSDDALRDIEVSGADEEIHEELLFARIILMQCIFTRSDSGYYCKEHSYIGTTPCACGKATYAITYLTDPTIA